MLLPPHFRGTDNSIRRRSMKHALNAAIESTLSPVQKRRIKQFYLNGMTKTQIATQERSSCSTVTKSLRAAQESIREYAEIYLSGYEQARKDIKGE